MQLTVDTTVKHACAAWAELIGASSSALIEPGVTVVPRNDDRPSVGWLQVVGTVISAPPELVGQIRGMGKRAAKFEALITSLGSRGGTVTGPAQIAWLPADWSPSETLARKATTVTVVEPSDSRVGAFHVRLPPLDQEEWLVQADHAHTLIRGGRVVSAALTQDVGNTLAHLGVATATDHRLQGHAVTVATAACQAALAAGRIPQYRARERNRGSWHVAAHVGFTPQARQALIGIRPEG